MQQPLQVIKLHPDAILPQRATEHDAGYDLFALDDVEISPRKKQIINTGIAIRMPVLKHPLKVFGSIRSRSGLSAKFNLETGAGVIDFSYEKAIGVILHNHGNNYYKVQKGDRIAQLILQVYIAPDVIEVQEFPKIENNDRHGGFGSTGR
jgi:dUTP pyrophosphatase